MTTDSPWIPLSERQPQASDWDETHGVEFCDYLQRSGVYQNQIRSLIFNWTHWRRVELPELPSKETTKSDIDLLGEELISAFKNLSPELALKHLVRYRNLGKEQAIASERAQLGGLSAEQFVKELREILYKEEDSSVSVFRAVFAARAMLDRSAKG